MLPGETLNSGAPKTCPECGVTVELAPYQSNAGWYLGSYCNCGPYSRESEYYDTREELEEAIKNNRVRMRY